MPSAVYELITFPLTAASNLTTPKTFLDMAISFKLSGILITSPVFLIISPSTIIRSSISYSPSEIFLSAFSMFSGETSVKKPNVPVLIPNMGFPPDFLADLRNVPSPPIEITMSASSMLSFMSIFNFSEISIICSFVCRASCL